MAVGDRRLADRAQAASGIVTGMGQELLEASHAAEVVALAVGGRRG